MTQAQEYSVEQIEASYNLRGLRPDYETALVPGWVERSQSFRAHHASARLDIAYGDGERDQLDLFPVADPKAPFLVYIHGGYWQRGDKSIYSFLAQPFVEQGISVALINYAFCPNVRLSAIAPQVRRALVFLWRNAKELRINRDDYHLMGHSAGGHLTVEMMCSNWSDEAGRLTARFLEDRDPNFRDLRSRAAGVVLREQRSETRCGRSARGESFVSWSGDKTRHSWSDTARWKRWVCAANRSTITTNFQVVSVP